MLNKRLSKNQLLELLPAGDSMGRMILADPIEAILGRMPRLLGKSLGELKAEGMPIPEHLIAAERSAAQEQYRSQQVADFLEQTRPSTGRIN